MLLFTKRVLTAVIAVGMLLALPATLLQAAPKSSDGASLEDLGNNLLDDAMLQELIDSVSKRQPALSTPSTDQPSLLPEIDDLRRMLDPKQQALPKGEDLGQRGESALARISNRMAEAGELIASRNTNGETREAQEEIVAELDKLIKQLNKQCQNCSGGQCNKPGSQQTQGSTPKPSGKPSASPGAQAALQQSRVSSGGEDEAQPGNVADREVIKQLWGQLPERLRQQLLQSTDDEFLPKYREELEMYFRRLAEEQSADEVRP